MVHIITSILKDSKRQDTHSFPYFFHLQFKCISTIALIVKLDKLQ